MTINNKMLIIKNRIEQSKSFTGIREHRDIRYGNKKLGYYIDNNTYFAIKYKGYEVNIYGTIDTSYLHTLEDLVDFDLHKWLNEILVFTTPRHIIGGIGKEFNKYRFIEEKKYD